ncbi:aminotransferase class IV [Hymenobacter baengnokdamensis]|uniref:aminotransferase class IV n=1 Tax=Hymenobacter baengnokdamensis TaxID=2615203 RepID=UPI0012470B91|nr:aminotransferase class IV [Hymenobacter baengnokdamensis]
MMLYNGELVDPLKFRLSLPNRGLAFGDGFFETLVFDGGLRYATGHLARMQQAAAALYLTLPAALATPHALETTLAQLLVANLLPAARLRLQLWRAGGGRYTPPTDSADWLATAEPFVSDNSPLQRVDFAQQTHAMLSPLSFCKGPQAWLYVRAAHERRQRGLDEIILCHAAGHVAEAGAAAIFWVRDEVLFTPALASGCVAGVRRAAVLQAALTLGIRCQQGLFGPADLLAADAAFTANVAAVRVIHTIQNKQYLANNRLITSLFTALA